MGRKRNGVRALASRSKVNYSLEAAGGVKAFATGGCRLGKASLGLRMKQRTGGPLKSRSVGGGILPAPLSLPLHSGVEPGSSA